MSRENFTYKQKCEKMMDIIFRGGFSIGDEFIIMRPVDDGNLGIFRCPLCKHFMSLGHKLTPKGIPYLTDVGTNLSIHIYLGFYPISKVMYEEINKIRRIELDHIVPCVWGGDASLENMIPVCDKCNREMGGNMYDKMKIILVNHMIDDLSNNKKKNKIANNVYKSCEYHKKKSIEREINEQIELIYEMEID